MTRTPLLAAAALIAAAISPAMAQDVGDLGTRPITRAEVLAAAKAQFVAMDTNQDGAVDATEFAAYRDRQAAGGAGGGGPFQHVGSHWFERADAKGDGRVTLDEAEARPMQMFDRADSDGDGVLSIKEQKAVLAMMKLRGR